MRKGRAFIRHVDEVLNECRMLEVEISRSAVEDIVEAQVRRISKQMGITEKTVVNTYMSIFPARDLAARIHEAQTSESQDIDDTPHAVLNVRATGRLLASLGQAARCVSLNHMTLSTGDKWDTIGILDDVSNAVSLIGIALAERDSGAGAIVLRDEAVVKARAGLQSVIDKLSSGQWKMYEERPDIDRAVIKGMTQDLSVLPATI
ncbi:hypothetical protein ABT297_42790 [Dactylosporangium sp. NPDC000555]|uniref:hypothetical protein n=1 Tax=Dactylosporangium sp. NPDC000555 TaxID=3154260 RepID=UPI00332F8FF0